MFFSLFQCFSSFSLLLTCTGASSWVVQEFKRPSNPENLLSANTYNFTIQSTFLLDAILRFTEIGRCLSNLIIVMVLRSFHESYSLTRSYRDELVIVPYRLCLRIYRKLKSIRGFSSHEGKFYRVD